jgi:hypothetical protein
MSEEAATQAVAMLPFYPAMQVELTPLAETYP